MNVMFQLAIKIIVGAFWMKAYYSQIPQVVNCVLCAMKISMAAQKQAALWQGEWSMEFANGLFAIQKEKANAWAMAYLVLGR